MDVCMSESASFLLWGEPGRESGHAGGQLGTFPEWHTGLSDRVPLATERIDSHGRLHVRKR
jgi:hypothetical protein